MKCIYCDVFKRKQEELLKECDSVFDAISDMKEFIKECKNKCNKGDIDDKTIDG